MHTHQKTALLTLGRLPKGLDVARALSAAGFRVIVAEPFKWHLCRVSRAIERSYQVTPPVEDRTAYLRDLETIIEKEQISLVVPISEETMHASALKQRLPPEVKFYGPGQKRMLALHSKLTFIQEAARYGLSVPETYELTDPAAQQLAQNANYILKPVNSCAGRGVSQHERGAAIPPPAPSDSKVIQEYVEGEAYASFSVAASGRERCTVVYRPVVTSGSVAVCFERVEPPQAISDWIATFIEQSKHTGFISFDFILNAIIN